MFAGWQLTGIYTLQSGQPYTINSVVDSNGDGNLTDRPNVLRAVLGTPAAPAHSRGAATHALLEANVDDATGELAASWIETLFAAGAGYQRRISSQQGTQNGDFSTVGANFNTGSSNTGAITNSAVSARSSAKLKRWRPRYG